MAPSFVRLQEGTAEINEGRAREKREKSRPAAHLPPRSQLWSAVQVRFGGAESSPGGLIKADEGSVPAFPHSPCVGMARLFLPPCMADSTDEDLAPPPSAPLNESSVIKDAAITDNWHILLFIFQLSVENPADG